MRFIWQHITTILDDYIGDVPLAIYLRNYCRRYPVLGSRDRKLLSTMAYSWYRCSKGVSDEADFETKMKKCLVLCNNASVLIQDKEIPGLKEVPFHITKLFPCNLQISDGITRQEWLESMLVQPELFIRVRKDKDKIIKLLNDKNIPFRFVAGSCLELPNATKVDTFLPQDAYVVQDASSQQTGAYFAPARNEKWFDCCAGAGGKSLLIKDQEPGIKLTVSDKREAIIHNLLDRFRLYRHDLPVAYVVDASSVTKLTKDLGSELFDHIICDAPCSGSGTWSRTPEQMYFFNPDSIGKFSSLQQQIAINVSQHLKPAGTLYYITCSVLRSENENVVNTIINQSGLRLTESQLINGTGIRADNMFIAILKKA